MGGHSLLLCGYLNPDFSPLKLFQYDAPLPPNTTQNQKGSPRYGLILFKPLAIKQQPLKASEAHFLESVLSWFLG